MRYAAYSSSKFFSKSAPLLQCVTSLSFLWPAKNGFLCVAFRKIQADWWKATELYPAVATQVCAHVKDLVAQSKAKGLLAARFAVLQQRGQGALESNLQDVVFIE